MRNEDLKAQSLGKIEEAVKHLIRQRKKIGAIAISRITGLHRNTIRNVLKVHNLPIG